ncbi:hypothetical protein AMTRI_Chr06g197520 [Amborella trichopoda]
MAYSTATPEQLKNSEGPKSRVDASYLLVHTINSEQVHKDEGRACGIIFMMLDKMSLLQQHLLNWDPNYSLNMSLNRQYSMLQTILLGERKLQNIDDFQEYSKSYSNESCRLGLHNIAICHAYYLAFFQGNIQELVLETPSMKNIAVQNPAMPNVVGCARGEIKKSCYKYDIITYIKDRSKICNTIEGAKEYNIHKFRKSIELEVLSLTNFTKETWG